jgi:hypothetical protein
MVEQRDPEGEWKGRHNRPAHITPVGSGALPLAPKNDILPPDYTPAEIPETRYAGLSRH